MVRSLLSISSLLMLAVGAGRAMADDVRYLDENGITYRETTQVTQRAIPQTSMQPRAYTYYRQRYTTELQDSQRTYSVPITEYQWKAETHRTWNPFAAPYVAYRLVPQTRWETKSETVKIPVAKVETVPEQITQQVPVTTHRVAQEKVVTRVAVGHSATPPGGASAVASSTSSGSPSTTAVSTGGGDQLGGLSKLDSDPPKQSPAWQESDGTARR
jgi:hypothetical protein